MNMKLKIFIDTNCLLNEFLKYKSNGNMSSYMNHVKYDLYTFEKCIFEAYSVFRGVHGKKPLVDNKDKWSSKFLKNDNVSNIDRLTSKYHYGSKEYALFMFNHVYEAVAGLTYDEAVEDMKQNVHESEHDKGIEHLKWLYALAKEKNYYEHVCGLFKNMLNYFDFNILSYMEVFNPDSSRFDNFYNPRLLDRFCIETAFPPEDFEIVFSALRLPMDVFVTEDTDVIKCAKSLGLNTTVNPLSFVKGENGFNNWIANMTPTA